MTRFHFTRDTASKAFSRSCSRRGLLPCVRAPSPRCACGNVEKPFRTPSFLRKQESSVFALQGLKTLDPGLRRGDESFSRFPGGRWSRRRHERGVVSIEFALIFLFGVLPLLLLTFSGVMIFAAKQSLELAAADGARAALQYQTTDDARSARATFVAYQSMEWLFKFSGQTQAPAIACTKNDGSHGAGICSSIPKQCTSDAKNVSVNCITVTTYYNYDKYPFLPGTKSLYGWLIGRPLQSSATIQLPAGS